MDISIDDLSIKLQRRACGCGGKRLGLWRSLADWLARATRRSPWAYKTSIASSRQPHNRTFEIRRHWMQDEQHPPPKWTVSEQGAPSREKTSGYTVYRTAEIDGESYVGHQCCICGAWSHERTGNREPGQARERLRIGYDRTFVSARSADEYARRLQHGVPQNWEVLTAAMAAVGGVVAAAVFELIEALL